MASAKTRLLIDAGLSGRELTKRLRSIGEEPTQLDGILITHEHSDHICGLRRLAKTLGVRIFMTALAAASLEWGDCLPNLECFQAGDTFRVGDIDVDSFTVPHDAVDPVGFCCRSGGVKVSLVTDLGYVPESVKVHVRQSDMLILESNHDLEMLKVGPYPWMVKQRVMSRRGHLSNEGAARFLQDSLDSRTSTIVLGHLSQSNNHPELVRMLALEALTGRAVFTKLDVMEPGKPSGMYCF